MTCRAVFLTATLMAFPCFFAACSQDTHETQVERGTVNGLPSLVATESATKTVKVADIDYTARMVSLQGSDGKAEWFIVRPEMKRLDQIKKGDTVKIQYDTRIFAYVRKSSEPPSASLSGGMFVTGESQLPGVQCTRSAHIDATVESIDAVTRYVQLKTASGNVLTFTANKDTKNLDKVRPGDQVVFDYTEAVTILVE
jgi:hypothetical protein